MASAAAFITWAALAGALISFAAGAVLAARRYGGPGRRWLALIWPFAMGNLKSAGPAPDLNKALVALLACLMIAAAAWSAAANLHRIAK